MPLPEPERPGAGPTLEHLLALIATGTLDVVAAPCGTGVPVSDVVLHDAGEERDEDAWAATGLVLLAVGVEVSSPDAAGVLCAADRAGAAAVVMRRGARGPQAALLEAAEQGRTALLTRPPGQGWTEVLGRLRTALAHSLPDGAGGAAGVDGLRLGDLPGLANTVADLVGGAITIEDPQSRVLAYSRMAHEPDPLRRLTILGQEVPRWRVAELRESGFFQALWSTDDVVRRPADDRYAERLAVAVRHGSEVLGSIWAAADGRPLAEDAVAALRTAGRAAVPHLSHHRTWGRVAARAREGAVHALLAGSVQAAHDVGIVRGRPYAVMVAEAHDGREPAPGDLGDRVLDVLALQAAAYRPGCVTARSGQRLYVLVPAADDETDPARTLLTAARSVPRGVVFAGAGPVVADLAELPASRDAAKLVVRVLRDRAARLPASGAGSAVASYAEVASEAAVLRLLDRMDPLWGALSGPVHAMLEHDRAHGSRYGASVAAHLDAFGDTAAAAERLHVHPNTLRYRLRRARELFGVDLADPAVRLLADIGLRLRAARP
ncbi:PucR family transcriptional regulator [Streptomyces sp. A0642]|uniref:PucR family transcriptional regulator n=1 Tax=Streptomyces sp. A0642 TaxID=2563100 RepID=UPI0010A20D5D|nr:helix-turn-helix domain-containing protein [Streptomyces sp. A0642]THA79396.1 PucR family transcriptional regulator [Streptomyces sp. A0642]